MQRRRVFANAVKKRVGRLVEGMSPYETLNYEYLVPNTTPDLMGLYITVMFRVATVVSVLGERITSRGEASLVGSCICAP